jgi:hypothetical protein
MNLRTSLPKVAPIQTTEEMENQILGPSNEGAAGPESITQEQVSGPRTPDAEPARATKPGSSPGPRREGMVLLNAKIPVSIHTRLKRTAQYNDVSMTDILLRGIEHELNSGRYSQPPSTWGLVNLD